MSTRAAILDRDGIITYVNPAWRTIGLQERQTVAPIVGTNYPRAVRAAGRDGDSAVVAADGIEKVLAGAVAEFALDYRCDGLGGEAGDKASQWRRMSVIAMRGRSLAAMVLHDDIEPREPADGNRHDDSNEIQSVPRGTASGKLAASIAHEINQPLAAIVMSAETAHRVVREGGPDGLPAIIDEILAAAKRAARIVRHAQAIARGDHSAFETTSLNDVVSSVVRLIDRDVVLRRVSLSIELAPEPLRVFGDRVQLQQVVLNLLVNALDAVGTQPHDRRRVGITTSPLVDGSVELSVSDSGAGITPDVSPRLFEPFVTSKLTGIGLGLANVRAIVSAHRGSVVAESTIGRGAVFRVRLPSLPN